MSKLEGGLAKRLVVTGMPSRYVHEVVTLVARWARCSGVEYTIQRMKSLKMYLIKRGEVPQGFSRNRKGGLKGVFGSLIRWGWRNEKNLGKVLQVLQLYTYFTFEAPTAKQRKKFAEAVSCDKPDNLSPEFHRDFALSLRRAFGVRLIGRSRDVSIVTYRGSNSRFRPGLGFGRIFPKSTTDKGVMDNLMFFSIRSYRSLFKEYWDLFSPVFKGIDVNALDRSGYLDGVSFEDRLWTMNWPVLGGEVHFLMQEGGKMRSIASPHLIFQMVLRHLGDSVYSLVQSLPWDCTFDQTKAIPHLQYALQQGSTVHSVDLSSATDYFPLSLQLSCLRAMFGNQPDIELFSRISRSYWLTSENNLVQWKRGQPLGLYPSFGTFTLTHGCLLWYLNNCKHDGKFFVLGDDVVILDDSLFHAYKSLLDTMHCPWSAEKSLTSDKLAEFAGKLITSSSVIPMMKYKNLSNDNFLDICRLLGPRSRSLLSRPQRKFFDAVKHLLPPVGLNFSYPGSSYAKMLEATERIWKPSEVTVASLMGLSGVIRKNIYGISKSKDLPIQLDAVLDLLTTFDEKVCRVLHALIPWELWDELRGSPILEGYAGVPMAVGNKTSPLLPLRDVVSSRESTLKRYQRMLADMGRS